MTFDLWSEASRTIVRSFPTESEALAAMREATEAQDCAYAEELAVIGEDGRGRSKAVADGAQLANRAFTPSSA